MFGIDDALIWGPLVGAAAGGLLGKKNPMQGALIGAGLGLGAGGLLGAAPAATGAAELPAGAILNGVPLEGGVSIPAAGASVNGSPLLGGSSIAPGASVSTIPTAETGGLFGQGASALKAAKPYTDAAFTGLSIANMFGKKQPIQPSPIAQNGGGQNSLAALSGALEQQTQQNAQNDQLRRQAQQALIARIGGRYGLA